MVNKKNIAYGIIILIVGVSVGVFLQKYYLPHTASENYVVREGGYNFINPLLSCDISENKQFAEYQPLKNKFQTYIEKNIQNGNATDISVYFRGLDSGHWSGVNENDKYSPASLLKVPIMIAYLKDADENPNILNQQIVYHQSTDENASETFKPAQYIKDGQSYMVKNLIEYMIEDSDNNAAQLLQDNVDQNSLTEVYSDLGIPVSSSNSEDSITPKQYSYIFRILYNATYLSKSMSQYALELLSASDFPQGIKAGLPASVPSSQKFGERTVLDQDPTTNAISLSYRELHDCGIVYYPGNPYLLCVMTKGADFSKLSKIISDISALVYQETSSGSLKI